MEIGGLKVVDATKALAIKVTKLDVVKGRNKSPATCAAARACLRADLCTAARVHLGRTYLKINNKWVRYQTPQAMRAEIIAFDRGAEFQPGEYILRPVPPSARPTGKQRGSVTGQNKPVHKRIKRAVMHQVEGVRAHGANR